MASGNSEYQVEYCGLGGTVAGSLSTSGGVGATNGYKPCSKSFESQPVGGKMQAAAREAAEQSVMLRPGGSGLMASQTGSGLPVYDEDFVTTVYSESQRGTHRVLPQWVDPRWTPDRRIASSALYERSERDPPHRQNFYLYKSTLIDPVNTPCKPLTVPDVHSLRYMHNNYMSPDDWY